MEMNQETESNKFLKMLGGHKGIIYKIVNSFCKDEENPIEPTEELQN